MLQGTSHQGAAAKPHMQPHRMTTQQLITKVMYMDFFQTCGATTAESCNSSNIFQL
jgi:hypothetical protein